MKETVKHYIPFIAGMATMVLLVWLISASLAKEDPPAVQPQVRSQPQVQAGDLRLACSEAGIALFGVERTAPGEAVTAANGVEIPAVVTYTDGKGEVHYYVEAKAIAGVLDVALGAEYNEKISCIDFGAQYYRDEQGEPLLRETREGVMEKIWWSCEPPCDFSVHEIEVNGKSMWVTTDTVVRSGSDSLMVTTAKKTPEELAEENARWAKTIRETPLKPEYGVSGGMFTEADPAEMDLGSWSGTAMKDLPLESAESSLERTVAFTPHLGEYAAITIENTGTLDVRFIVTRPYTVGNYVDEFSIVRVPAGQTLTRAFRIDPELPLENQLTVRVQTMAAAVPVQVKLTAEQYRFGK